MKKGLCLFILVFLVAVIPAFPVQADASFSLVNASYTKNIESTTTDFKSFWAAITLDFTPSSDDPNLYEASSEATASESINNGHEVHNITGSVTAKFDASTGVMEGEYQITHTITITPPTKYQSNWNGTITDVYTGTFTNNLAPGDTSVTLNAKGPWSHSISGTPYGGTAAPGEEFDSSWEFIVDYQIEGTIPGRSCSPDVSGLDGLKPGDTLSPSAIYHDTSGNEVDVLQERWYINGEETPSIVWDGQPVTIELQWTCPDHAGYSATYTVAAYSGPTSTPLPAGMTSSEQQNTNTPGQDLPAGAIAALSVFGAGVAGLIGVLIHFLTKASPKPTPPPPAPFNPTASAAPSPSIAPSLAPPPLTYQPNPAYQATPSPLPPQPTMSPQALTNLRDEMIRERDRLKAQWQQTRDAVEKLKLIKKKNLLKFMMRQGFEVKDWIMNSPTELLSKITIDPAMEKMIGKHDTSQDPNIIVAMNNRIESLKAEMDNLVQQTKYLNQEIKKIEIRLGKR